VDGAVGVQVPGVGDEHGATGALLAGLDVERDVGGEVHAGRCAPAGPWHPSSVPRPPVLALGGLLGPAAFVSAWLVGGRRTSGYSPARDAISRLAAEGAPTRSLMTAGFMGFGVLVPLAAPALARTVRAPGVRATATVAGLATLAVAATPLTRDEGTTQDTLHSVWAATGYVAMALTPLVAARALRRDGRRRAASLSLATGAVSALSLVGTVVLPWSGGAQRLGLGVVDVWLAVVAVAALRRR
jgi:hypothetical membrane protein